MWVPILTVLCLACLANGEVGEKRIACANFHNPSNGIKGKIIFENTKNGTLITGNITGLSDGPHGFHIHEFGNITDTNCTLAGSHFNPFNKTHGALRDRIRHLGDLGNIESENNSSSINLTAPELSFDGVKSIIGRAIVVHADVDDLGRGNTPASETTGNSGPALACGVIKLEKCAGVQQQASIFLSIFLVIFVLLTRH